MATEPGPTKLTSSNSPLLLETQAVMSEASLMTEAAEIGLTKTKINKGQSVGFPQERWQLCKLGSEAH